ncbi:E3 UFM1-protein ligase 1 homolog isoform X1 [Hydractinia symbiolongicarpus]|uniref:E3 UFM1-protein ligase 1 homolog isoform X1 n=1 Tax=Hydractinia symbiolongicarpus TaxID=13093 RepID=UPI00254E1A23|nr:E3 UFM1-protein ligase 1 homolog isoform X1 [Hydractinia symbiolongicarpus]
MSGKWSGFYKIKKSVFSTGPKTKTSLTENKTHVDLFFNMAASDWEEIKRLAADFQRAQLSSTSHKLSERNCIEIVNKLVALGLVEVIYTTDGKEYLTPKQVEREIRDELIVHGGRINLVDLQQILNIDLSHIESKVNEIVRGDRHFSLVQGQLLDRDYLDRTAEEINEALQEAGQVAIADLAKTFNLPIEFLLSLIETRLGTQIHGQLDPINRDVLFTAAFIARNIARIRGIFSAITKPTQVIQLVAQYGLPEKLFFNVLQTLVESQRLSGAVQGRQEKAIYVPDIYSETQTNYIDSFFKQNGYIEYQSLTKLGIADGPQFIKKRFGSKKDCMYLSTCCISPLIVDQVDAAIDEALTNNSWVDVRPLVPSPFTNEDVNLLLHYCMKSPTRALHSVFCQRIVASSQFIAKCKSIFDPLMKNKATKDIKMSPALFAELTRKEKTELTESATGEGKQVKREERQKKAVAGGGQKGGAGRGGRESGTKKTKNKYRDRMKGNLDDELDDKQVAKKSGKQQELKFLSEEEIHDVLIEHMKDCDDEEFLMEVASVIVRPLTRDYQEVAKSIFMTSSGTSVASKRKSHQDYQEKITGLMHNIKLFEKGLNLFEDETRALLSKHLLRTVASDVVNIVFEMVANENLMSLAENEMFTAETRLKLLSKLPEQWKSALTKLNSSLGKDCEDFYTQFDRVAAADYCDILIRKIDKKKERQLLFNHRQALIEELNRETEPAMALHLACIILFQYHTNTLLHAPGRCVPQIITYLQNNVSVNDFKKLSDYQNLVIQQLSKKRTKSETGEVVPNENETDSAVTSTAVLLAEGLAGIKLVVKNMKKSNIEE